MNKNLIKINKKTFDIKIINKAISIEGNYGIEIIKLHSNIFFVKENNILYSSNCLAVNIDNIKVYLKFKEICERIKGLSKGYKRQLIIMGVGFKMFVHKKNTLILKLGRSHNNHIHIPIFLIYSLGTFIKKACIS